jgi:peptidyl-prolyl cis-trans isomerase SurA
VSHSKIWINFMIKFRYSFCTAILLVSTPSISIAATTNTASKAAPALNIVAVVGDQAISSFDVDARVKFIVTTTKISSSPEVLKNIRPQVIRALIDESLQRQKASDSGIKINDEDIAKAIASIETQRGMQLGAISAMLTANKVPTKTFTDQVSAQLSWNKWVSKNIIPYVKVSDEEIAMAKARIIAEPNVNEMEISIIALPVDKKKSEASVSKTADNLVKELRSGAKFEEVARQFSGSDGKSFWVRPQELEPSIAQILIGKKEGEITSPIRTADGFSIIKIFHVRTAEAKIADEDITLKEILLKLKPDAPHKETDALLEIAQEVAKHSGTCEEKGIAGISDMDSLDIAVNFHTTPSSELPPAIRTIVGTLKIGEISSPFASDEGIRLYMLCGKKEAEDSPTSQAKIREALLHQKFELEAQKNLRNLRRDTFIEIRE